MSILTSHEGVLNIMKREKLEILLNILEAINRNPGMLESHLINKCRLRSLYLRNLSDKLVVKGLIRVVKVKMKQHGLKEGIRNYVKYYITEEGKKMMLHIKEIENFKEWLYE